MRLGPQSSSGRVVAPVAFHSGFTGTWVAADPRSGTVAVLLTNRVHPHRSWFTVEASRKRLTQLAFGDIEDRETA
jgi:CubicO group peptidase (beta-lactamase class C family)